MLFQCPACKNAICSGLSHREFIIIDDDFNLEGLMICRCPICKKKIRLSLEGLITRAVPLVEDV